MIPGLIILYSSHIGLSGLSAPGRSLHSSSSEQNGNSVQLPFDHADQSAALVRDCTYMGQEGEVEIFKSRGRLGEAQY